jgi:hypothetical protein
VLRNALLSCLLALPVSCTCGTSLNPEGYACDANNSCPAGFTCISGACRSNGTGGGASMGGGGGAMGGGAGGGSSDPCAGVSCDTAPMASCKDGSTLKTFATPGTCSTGNCSYAETDVPCTQGCVNNMCVGQNLCAGKTCDMPPSSSCMGNSVRTYSAMGSCDGSTGMCNYAFTDTPCLVGCSNGKCVQTMLTFAQTMPRVPFAIRGLDQAPASNGATALVVGANGQALKWDGTKFSAVTTNTQESLNSVWFSSATNAWVVGSNRTLFHFVNGAFATVSNTQFSGSANLIAVHGIDDNNVAVASDDGQWGLWNGLSWLGGQLSGSNTYDMRGVYLDPAGHVRIAGACDGTPCVAYRSVTTLNWFEDTDSTATDPFNAIGPAPTTSATTNLAWAGRSLSSVIRVHDGSAGTFNSTGVPTLSDNSIWGITGAALGSGATTRAMFLLTDAHLYRFNNGTLDTPLADLFFGAGSMGGNDSAGVLVAETDIVHGVNNIYHRGGAVDELLDLGESWATATVSGTSLVMVSGFGDVATRAMGENVWHFRRGPVMVAADATGANGNGVLMVGQAGKIELATTNGFTSVTSGTSQDLSSVCRVSATEAYVVGAAGVALSVNSTTGTASAMTSGSNAALSAVDCPATGQAVACGAGGAALVLKGGAWTKLPDFPGGAALASCRLSGSVLFAVGDNAFGSIDTSAANPAWQSLTGAAKLHSLVVFGANDAYAVSGTNTISHYDGMSWSPRFTLTGQGSLAGGGQVGGKVVYAGSLGVLVESQ